MTLPRLSVEALPDDEAGADPTGAPLCEQLADRKTRATAVERFGIVLVYYYRSPSRPAALVLRQAVRDVVVVALVGYVDMNPQSGVRGQVECPHGDSDPVLLDRVPEERGAASGTEASSHLLGRAEPREVIATLDRQGGAGDVRGRKEMARMLPAL
jgi:hypothetical protein